VTIEAIAACSAQESGARPGVDTDAGEQPPAAHNEGGADVAVQTVTHTVRAEHVGCRCNQGVVGDVAHASDGIDREGGFGHELGRAR
jgi:hypothetical protein